MVSCIDVISQYRYVHVLSRATYPPLSTSVLALLVTLGIAYPRQINYILKQWSYHPMAGIPYLYFYLTYKIQSHMAKQLYNNSNMPTK